MITLLTGSPGAGKTAQAAAWIEEACKAGRAVFVYGLEGLKLPHAALDDPHKWHETVPDGALIVIDEVQHIWRPARSGGVIPPDVVALETHRHRGLDFLLTTQSPALLHLNVRRLVGRHVHLVDFGWLGRRWYEWSECSDSLNRDKAMVKRKYRLPRHAFAHYTSASIHVKPVRGFPRALAVMAIAVPATVGFAYAGYSRIQAKTEKPKAAASSPNERSESASMPAQPASSPKPSAGILTAAMEVIKPTPLAGCISMGPRCECIDIEGRSVEVDLKQCRADASRSGMGIAYSLKTGSGRPSADGGVSGPPAARMPTAGESSAASQSRGAYGWNAGEMRSALPSSPGAATR